MANTIKLNQDIFGLEVASHELLKVAYDSYLANSRSSHAKTLTRAEVRGGGKKPWKQKGTGRARFGSTRNPIWRHGGIAGGRTGIENFTKTLNKTAKKVAIRQALSLANQGKILTIVDDFTPKDGKTKEALAFLTTNKVNTGDHTLLVVAEKTDNNLRATRNLESLKMVRATYLNVFDILNADRILIEKSALPQIEEWLGGQND